MASDLVLKIIYESTLLEVGDLKEFIYSFKGPINLGDDNYKYNYYSENPYTVVDVFFENITDNYKNHFSAFVNDSIYSVFYKVNNNEIQDRKDTYQTLLNILSTNFQVIKDFISKYNPDILLLNGNYKPGELTKNSPIKSRLYGAIVDKKINELSGYRYTTQIINEEGYFVVFKNVKKKK